MTQINWKLSCVHGLEELMLLKHPYYPKQTIYSILSPLESILKINSCNELHIFQDVSYQNPLWKIIL
jgi:hypothetical protein